MFRWTVSGVKASMLPPLHIAKKPLFMGISWMADVTFAGDGGHISMCATQKLRPF